MRSPPTYKDKMYAPALHRHVSSLRGVPHTSIVRRRSNTDEVKLLMLGYRQELAREFTLFNSFGSSFTSLSCLTALGGTFGIGLMYGGPVVMTWGWLVVTFFTTSMGLSMAELVSAYPTSGALYYWSYTLAPRRLRILACWMTGWILMLGQGAFTASNTYTLVHLVCAAIRVQFGLDLNGIQQLLLLAGTLVFIGLLNCGSSRMTAFITTLGTLWHMVALAAFCLTVPMIAPARQTAKYVYTSWQPHHEETGISSAAYTVMVGLLMQQWTLTGYDGAAHLAEETLDAEVNVPRAIVLTILGVGASGFAFVLSLLFVKFDLDLLTSTDNETGGTNVVLQILIEISKVAYGSSSGGLALFTIPIVGTFFCSYQSIANNSRMLYAFARDNGVPMSFLAKRVHPRSRAPVWGVVYMLLLTSLLAMPMCLNAFVFPALTSFAVVACYLAYSLPVLCKLSTGTRYFLPGPFSLGPRLSFANNAICLSWVLTVMVIFTLPQFYPIELINLNWSAPILSLAVAFLLGWYYFPKYGAKYWFIGPRANLGQFQDILPSDLARIATQKDMGHVSDKEEAAAAATTAATSRLSQVIEESEAPQSCRGSNSSCVRRISRPSVNRAPRAMPTVAASGPLLEITAAATVAAPLPPSISFTDSSSDGERPPGSIFDLGSSQGSAGTRAESALLRCSRVPGPGHTNLTDLQHCCLAAGHSAAAAGVTGGGSGRSVQRQPALNLIDGPLSYGSHISHLLQDNGLVDEGSLQANTAMYGGGAVGMELGWSSECVAVDGRSPLERGSVVASRWQISRGSRPSTGARAGEAMWSIWSAGMGGGHNTNTGGGRSTAGQRERPSTRARDRTAPASVSAGAPTSYPVALASSWGGTKSHGGPQLLALGGHPINQVRVPCYSQLHINNMVPSLELSGSVPQSDSSIQIGSSARTRIRRASVSVVTYLQGCDSGGVRDTVARVSSAVASRASRAGTTAAAAVMGAGMTAPLRSLYLSGVHTDEGLGPRGLRPRRASHGCIGVDTAVEIADADAEVGSSLLKPMVVIMPPVDPTLRHPVVSCSDIITNHGDSGDVLHAGSSGDSRAGGGGAVSPTYTASLELYSSVMTAAVAEDDAADNAAGRTSAVQASLERFVRRKVAARRRSSGSIQQSRLGLGSGPGHTVGTPSCDVRGAVLPGEGSVACLRCVGGGGERAGGEGRGGGRSLDVCVSGVESVDKVSAVDIKALLIPQDDERL